MTHEPDSFLPETSTMPAPGGFRALYRFFSGQSWRPVCDKHRNAIIYKDVIQAIKAAKEVLRVKLNPDLKCSTIDVAPDDADVLGIEEWRKKKIEQYGDSKAIVRNGKRHAPFVVERKVKKKLVSK